MKHRDEHCSFANLNGGGRCVAHCHYNLSSGYEQDCTGNTASHKDGPYFHEPRVAMMYVDPDENQPEPKPMINPLSEAWKISMGI